MLSQFYPLSAPALETQFDADLAAPGWPGRKNQDAASGEAVGRAVGASVLAQAATDNYLVVVPPTQPPGPGEWVPLPNPVRSLYGVRPFFLTSGDQIRPGPPPAFGSPEYLAALAEIRAISDTRTAEQVSIAQSWAFQTAPFTAGAENLIADQLIAEHHRSEKDAARILAYATPRRSMHRSRAGTRSSSIISFDRHRQTPRSPWRSRSRTTRRIRRATRASRARSCPC